MKQLDSADQRDVVYREGGMSVVEGKRISYLCHALACDPRENGANRLVASDLKLLVLLRFAALYAEVIVVSFSHLGWTRTPAYALIGPIRSHGHRVASMLA